MVKAPAKRIGKKAEDIFAPTTARPNIGLEVAPRPGKGRPTTPEPYSKVTVCLLDRHVLYLDKVALAIRERSGGKPIRRVELIRALVETAAARLNPDKPGPDFDKAILELMPTLSGGDAQ